MSDILILYNIYIDKLYISDTIILCTFYTIFLDCTYKIIKKKDWCKHGVSLYTYNLISKHIIQLDNLQKNYNKNNEFT